MKGFDLLLLFLNLNRGNAITVWVCENTKTIAGATPYRNLYYCREYL
jgi:hypothetical protein